MTYVTPCSWAIQLRHISKMYDLDDPLDCLKKDPPSKPIYQEHILTKITAFHERELRLAASKNKDEPNSKMKYLNVSLLGLRGKLHPAVTNVFTTHSVKKMRPHLKMLAGNYLTFEEKSQQSGGSPFCRICNVVTEPESLEHLISRCVGLSETRTNILNLMTNLCQGSSLNIDLSKFSNSELTQWILDPSSMSLKTRVNIAHPILPSLLQLSRDFCYKIDRTRQISY